MSSSRLPASTPSARSLLLTLLGEYVHPTTDRIWTHALLRALALAGVSERAARQALARAHAAGWITGGKAGRQAWWALAEHGRGVIVEGSRRVRSLVGQADAWAGEWLVLHVTMPESRRAERLRLYRSLQWMGFGSPTTGMWICPRPDRAAAVAARLDELGIADDTLAFQGRALDVGVAQHTWVERAWDMSAVAAHYLALEDRFAGLRASDPQACFEAHVQLVNAIQRLPAVDPGLPRELLPADWVGTRVTQHLQALRTRWREPAHAYWKSLGMATAGADASLP